MEMDMICLSPFSERQPARRAFAREKRREARERERNLDKIRLKSGKYVKFGDNWAKMPVTVYYCLGAIVSHSGEGKDGADEV